MDATWMARLKIAELARKEQAHAVIKQKNILNLAIGAVLINLQAHNITGQRRGTRRLYWLVKCTFLQWFISCKLF
jgi:hypothetical protein